jgi:hypothetical protein
MTRYVCGFRPTTKVQSVNLGGGVQLITVFPQYSLKNLFCLRGWSRRKIVQVQAIKGTRYLWGETTTNGQLILAANGLEEHFKIILILQE